MDFLNTSRNRAMLHFAGWYLLSVLLLGAVAFALWRNGSITWANNQDTKFESEASYVETDVALYNRLQAVEVAYGQYLTQKNESTTSALTAARNDFATNLDNLRKQAQLQQDAKARQGLEELVNRYDASFKLKTSLFSQFEQASANSSTTPPGSTTSPATANPSSNSDVENLKAQLAEKDRVIASLQNAGNTSSVIGGDEWKKKYTSLKASHDKSVAAEQELKAAYQTVVKDNQRLLQQIQSLRKG